MKSALKMKVVAAMIAGCMPLAALAVGGPSGAKVDYRVPGKLGEVVANPYDIAPLTAIIKNGGYVLKNVHVRIVPKNGGQEISYKVDDKLLLTHGGIPVWGLYADYNNKVEVSYTRIYGNKTEDLKETYTIYAPPVYGQPSGAAGGSGVFFKTTVKKVDPEFKDRLYLINNLQGKSAVGTRVVWNNPVGGALEWNFYPMIAIIDTAGETRWFMDPKSIYDLNSIYRAGVMMGFKQNDDGQISFGYGQRYAKYDLMGREIFNRRLPGNYNDFSHSIDNSPNGNYFIRVGSANYKRPDGKNVRTVRDVIAEVNPDTGNVIDEWRLFEILDPYRDVNMKVLDQGAVCLNIDGKLAGKTLSEDEIAKLDASEKFGDIVGTGPGRNWAHVNSVDHDTEDDSIIISSRHQSAVIKIGRDKKVKWILGSPEGWKGDFAKKVLTPVDKNGKPIKCEDSKCEGDFDWTWTQHTAFKIDEKSKGNTIFVSVFDNGDSRGMEQPALPSMKYSRAVIYKIDQKKMTVQQIWEYGKDRSDWYSPVTSLVEYQADKNSVVAYSATSGADINLTTGALTSAPNPVLNEFKWGAKEPSVEIQLQKTSGYQAMPISLHKAFEVAK